MTMLLYRLGRACVRHRRRVLAAWIVAAVAVVAGGQALGGKTKENFTVPGVESQRATDVLEERFPAAAGTSAQLVFAVVTGTLDDPEAAATVEAALDAVAAQPDVLSVGELELSAGGTVAIANVEYARAAEDIRDEAFDRLEATAAETTAAGVQLELGGELPTHALQEPPEGQERFGLVAAVFVLLFAFGSVVAMGLPIATALVGLTTSFGFITLIAALTDISSTAPTLAAMIGLGVGIDYALFIVTRHRDNLRLGLTVQDAAGRALATSGAAVVFAGMTVVIAICGLTITGVPLVTAMGLMSGLTVAVMVAVSLTLLPALLGFAGHRIDSLRVPKLFGRSTATTPTESVWHRWGQKVSARPWTFLAAGVLVLGVLSAPLLGLRMGMSDNGTMPESFTTRRAYDILADAFGPGVNGPLLVSVELDAPATVDDLDGLVAAAAADPGIAEVSPPLANEAGDAAVFRILPESAPEAAETTALVHRLRRDVIPGALAGVPGARAYVGGQTATFIDLSDKVADRMPWFIGAVIGLSVLLLMTVFRSIAVPIKAALMNLLSIGAAYGVLVAVFQWGWLKAVFGLEETVPIISFIPMMMFAILFGLSMDYEVFLLSRVREEYAHRRDNEAAVIEGIAATARVITSAALIMISVFAAFVLGDDTAVKMFGLGLAVAVLIDATIVRIILVPATMRLLGDRNWWLPRWLDRLLPDLDVEGGAGLPAPELDAGAGGAVDPGDDEPEREPALV